LHKYLDYAKIINLLKEKSNKAKSDTEKYIADMVLAEYTNAVRKVILVTTYFNEVDNLTQNYSKEEVIELIRLSLLDSDQLVYSNMGISIKENEFNEWIKENLK